MIVLNEEFMCTVILKASHFIVYNEETLSNVKSNTSQSKTKVIESSYIQCIVHDIWQFRIVIYKMNGHPSDSFE